MILFPYLSWKRNTNTHEYTRIRKNKFMKNSWAFMIIRVEKRKTRIAVNYPLITQKLLMTIRVYS